MSEILLTTTPADGFRRLQVHGQAVVDMHHQLATILGNRLGRQHAQLLSRPEVDPGGGIAWYGPPLGPVRKLGDLADAEHRSIETLRRRLLADIGELARMMKGEGESAELVAHMLELATITPSDDAAYAVGAQPVLVLWGHATEAQAVPEPPKFAGPPPATPGHAIPPALPSEPVVPAAPDPPAVASAPPAAHADTVAAMGAPARRGRLPWLLPLLLLLLLALLLWRASQPLPPIVVERQGPAPAPPADPVPAEQDREKALRAELAELTRARDERLAMCKPIAPPAAPQPVPPLAPPKVSELAPPPPPPLPQPKPAPPKAEAKAKPGPPPEAEVRPSPPVPPKDVATAPLPPPMPPRSKCSVNVAPGDEPEVVVIVDGSGSMGEPYGGLTSKMTLAKSAIANVVTGLPDPVDVALIDFSNCDQVRLDKFFPAAERPTLIGEVRSLQPDRGTPLARSIERAGNIVSADVESTIVVVSDGEDTCGRDPCAAARAVKAKRPNITINVIDLGRGEGQAMMHCIAGATGGKVLTPNSSLDMTNKVQQATRLPDTRNCK
ncbi:MAG: VWA domain-containing protein [Bacteroidota bacterium]